VYRIMKLKKRPRANRRSVEDDCETARCSALLSCQSGVDGLIDTDLEGDALPALGWTGSGTPR
jgi:hypothetical protein